MLNVVDMEKRLKGNEERIGGFDLIWRNGPMGTTAADGSHIVRTLLGCRNDMEIPVSRSRSRRRWKEHPVANRSLT